MRLRRDRPLTIRDRAAIEAAAIDRYKRHVDMARMADELRAQRDEVEALSTFIWNCWDHLPAYLRADAEARIGAPPANQPTSIGVTRTGQFVELDAAGG